MQFIDRMKLLGKCLMRRYGCLWQKKEKHYLYSVLQQICFFQLVELPADYGSLWEILYCLGLLVYGKAVFIQIEIFVI